MHWSNAEYYLKCLIGISLDLTYLIKLSTKVFCAVNVCDLEWHAMDHAWHLNYTRDQYCQGQATTEILQKLQNWNVCALQ